MKNKNLLKNNSHNIIAVLFFLTFIFVLTPDYLISQGREPGVTNVQTPLQQLNALVKLTQKLEIESLRGIEYFNSPAYGSLTQVGKGHPERLKTRIHEPNRKYFLTLLALREISGDDVYTKVDTRMKTGILFDALKQAKFFNTWGLPHLYKKQPTNSFPREAPVAAVIELGIPVISRVSELLLEQRNAPFWGGDENERGSQYQVNDYAVALIMEIERANGIQVQDTTFNFLSQPDPNEERAERDNIINKYIEKYIKNNE